MFGSRLLFLSFFAAFCDILQACDVSHTMQHWHVYVKWNQNLFDEMQRAFVNGRSDKDPAKGWYEGELSFFDNYVM